MPDPLRKIGELFLDIIETFAIALSIFLVVYLFLLQPHQVNGQSMEPNFLSGEYVLTDKISYKLGDPKRGDVIVFHAPEAAHCPEGTGCDFIKRVLGLPGETIEVKDNHVYVNSTPLEEPYIPDTFRTDAGQATKGTSIYLGTNEYFVCGDNRPYSSDSRAWGPIQKADIIGRAFFRYWPVEVMGTLEHYSYQL